MSKYSIVSVDVSSPVARLLARLRGARQTGPNRWQACCPAHDDRRPSLSIASLADGTILLHCHAGCNPKTVVEALGLELRDLFPRRPDRRNSRPHRLGPVKHFGNRSVVLAASESGSPDFAELACRWAEAGRPLLHQLAEQLGLPEPVLQVFGTGWAREHWAWSIPMFGDGGRVTGIRLRSPGGRKWSLRGSKEGLFAPQHLFEAEPPLPMLMITEGASDAAAAWALGYHFVAGRPSCSGGIQLIQQLADRLRPRRVVIVPDNDNPGLEGAQRLAAALPHSDVRIVLPPTGHKDLRDAVKAGLTAEQLSQAIESSSPVKIRLSVRIRL